MKLSFRYDILLRIIDPFVPGFNWTMFILFLPPILNILISASKEQNYTGFSYVYKVNNQKKFSNGFFEHIKQMRKIIYNLSVFIRQMESFHSIRKCFLLAFKSLFINIITHWKILKFDIRTFLLIRNYQSEYINHVLINKWFRS